MWMAKIFHLSTDEAQHGQSNQAFPQCPTKEPGHPLRPHFKVWPREAAAADSQLWQPQLAMNHHLLRAQAELTLSWYASHQPTQVKIKHSSHTCRLDMNKWPRNLGGSKSHYPLPEPFSCHTKLVVTYFVWAAWWGWRTTQSLLCHLVLKLCITHSTYK